MESEQSAAAELEIPPGFVIRTEAQKAAWDNGFRVERGVEGGWLRFVSTTAQVTIWIAGTSKNGPWLLSVDRPEVSAEIGLPLASAVIGPGVATFAFDTLQGLYGALSVSTGWASVFLMHRAMKGSPSALRSGR